MATLIGTWLAAFLTLCIFSFLYKDNPFYKLAEHIFVGGSVAYLLIQTWYFTVQPMLVRPLIKEGISQNYMLIIPAALGIMVFTRWLPTVGWISRWPIAFSIGVGTGLGITGNIQGILLPQLKATIVPLNSVSNVIMVIAVVTTIVYFYFSRERKGGIGFTSRIGMMFIMTFFGASFGYTVMARVSLLIGRSYFLLHSWLHLIQ